MNVLRILLGLLLLTACAQPVVREPIMTVRFDPRPMEDIPYCQSMSGTGSACFPVLCTRDGKLDTCGTKLFLIH